MNLLKYNRIRFFTVFFVLFIIITMFVVNADIYYDNTVMITSESGVKYQANIMNAFKTDLEVPVIVKIVDDSGLNIKKYDNSESKHKENLHKKSI